jgi:hypothetical protein
MDQYHTGEQCSLVELYGLGCGCVDGRCGVWRHCQIACPVFSLFLRPIGIIVLTSLSILFISDGGLNDGIISSLLPSSISSITATIHLKALPASPSILLRLSYVAKSAGSLSQP